MGHVVSILLIIDFVKQNPGFAAWLIGGLFSLLGSMVVVYYVIIYSRLGKVEARVEELEERASSADSSVASLQQKVTAHMDMEEERIWPGIESIHAELSRHGERLAHIEERIGVMPQGDELKSVLKLLRRLVDRRAVQRKDIDNDATKPTT